MGDRRNSICASERERRARQRLQSLDAAFPMPPAVMGARAKVSLWVIGATRFARAMAVWRRE